MSSLNTPTTIKHLDDDINRIDRYVYELEEKIFELEITWQVLFKKMSKRIDALERFCLETLDKPV